MRWIALPLLAAFLQPPGALASPVARILPAGEDVPPGQQLVIEFDRPVVPLGQVERRVEQVPVRIEPALACAWRWLGTRTLACELPGEQALAPATRYTVTLDPGAADWLAAAGLAAPRTHTFTTRRPALQQAVFREWLGPGWPVLRLTSNHPVTAQALVERLRFVDPEVPERPYPVQLQVEPEHGEEVQVAPAAPPTDARRVWLASPVTELPAERGLELRISPGLVSPAGPEAGVEDRAVARIDTLPAPRFLGLRCMREADGEWVLLAPTPPAAGAAADGTRCRPLGPVSLVFSAPVPWQEARRSLRLSPPLPVARPGFDPWTAGRPLNLLNRAHTRGQEYHVRLPAGLKAATGYHLQAAPGALADAFGRTLADGIELRFDTGHREPRLVLAHGQAVLEQAAATEVPIYVTNLERVDASFRRLTEGGASPADNRAIRLPPVRDLSFAVPMGVREMLAGRSGVVLGSLATTPPVPGEATRTFMAQVTPFQVHAKLGHFSSLVWVTDLATGKPVPGARVALHRDRYAELSLSGAALATARTDGEGIARLPGASTFDPDLSLRQAWEPEAPRLFLRVEGDAGLAVLPLDGDFALWTYDVPAYPRVRDGHLQSWGTSAQGVYRAGDVIDYKLYVRARDEYRLIPPPPSGYSLAILDPKGEVVHEEPGLVLSDFGAFSGRWTPPADAATGWYRFRLQAAFLAEPLEPLRVLVSDFTPAPFRVQTLVPARRVGPDDALTVRTVAQLHGGGPYGEATARVVAQLVPTPLELADPRWKDFRFDTRPPGPRERPVLLDRVLRLDAAGEGTSELRLQDQEVAYGRLRVESAVQDERGRSVAASAAVTYVGRDRLVGLRTGRGYEQAGQPFTLEYLVVGVDGEPVAGVPVEVRIQREVVRAARVKGAGNAYLTRYSRSWQAMGECRGESAGAPLPCAYVPPEPGSYRVRALITDTAGRPHATEITVWVAGPGEVLWDDPAEAALELIPEQPTYHVGDTARFLVKHGLPGSLALVTVERHGILRARVQPLQDSASVVEVTVEPDDVPGFYLSVLIFSPRVDLPPASGTVDLGKPTYRLGYATVPVQDPYKELSVRVETDRAVYRPRDTVRARFSVQPRHPGPAQPLELAVAVLDEAVFDLIRDGADYFDPYRGFYGLEALDVANYSLLSRLVGRQRFEDKGATPGGDGGQGPDLRSRFRFLAHWTPALPVDAEGRAELEFPVPDNLSGWRILAIATSPGDRMGLGQGRFSVTKPLELRPLVPNQVLAGDRFEAAFSALNRSERPRTVTLSLEAGGAALADPGPVQESRVLALAPFARATIRLPVQTARPGEVHLRARVTDGEEADAMARQVPVGRRVPLTTRALAGSTVAATVREALRVPAGALPGVGGLRLTLAPSLLGQLDGVFGFARDYPHACWEQSLTRAVLAASLVPLGPYLPPDLHWAEARTLPAQVLAGAAGFQTPSGAFAFWRPDDELASPYLAAYTALAFEWLRQEGHAPPPVVERRLDDYLQRLLREDPAPGSRSPATLAASRAVALAALAARGGASRDDLERLRPHLPRLGPFGEAHLLQAAVRTEGADALAAALLERLAQRVDASSGALTAAGENGATTPELLGSPVRDTCAVLGAVTAAGIGGAEGGAERRLAEALARGIVAARGRSGHWAGTQENVFCVRALADYARAFEAETPELRVRASLVEAPSAGSPTQAPSAGEAPPPASAPPERDPGEQAPSASLLPAPEAPEPMPADPAQWSRAPVQGEPGEATLPGEVRFSPRQARAVTLERPAGPEDPGRTRLLVLQREGTGRLYYDARLSFAEPAAAREAVNAGLEVHREYALWRDGSWVPLPETAAATGSAEGGAAAPAVTDGSRSVVRRGDLLRVDLFLSVPAARHYVVVDDPVPGALEPVNRDLATTSAADADAAATVPPADSRWHGADDWVEFGWPGRGFYHQELRHDAARFYADYLPAGRYHLSYTAQVVAAGRFTAPGTRAEAMYAPEIQGRTAARILVVEEE